MQSNFNSLQKPYQMSARKCRAVFLTDNKWSLTQHFQIFCLPLIWCEHDYFVLLMKAQITRKWIKLYRPFYMHYARTHSNRFKTNEDLSRNEKCKVTFGVKYMYKYNYQCNN